MLLHGGPGSGSSPRLRQMFDPERYLIVGFDQRNCGSSTPSVASPEVEDGQILQDIGRLAHIPTYLTHGRRDISAPVDIPYALTQALPRAELFISETEGHGGPLMEDWTITVLDRLAAEAS